MEPYPKSTLDLSMYLTKCCTVTLYTVLCEMLNIISDIRNQSLYHIVICDR